MNGGYEYHWSGPDRIGEFVIIQAYETRLTVYNAVGTYQHVHLNYGDPEMIEKLDLLIIAIHERHPSLRYHQGAGWGALRW